MWRNSNSEARNLVATYHMWRDRNVDAHIVLMIYRMYVA